MIDQATTDMLKSMKMSAMAQEFEGQLSEPAFKELGFEERFGLLVNAEWNRRQNNKLNRYLISLFAAAIRAGTPLCGVRQNAIKRHSARPIPSFTFGENQSLKIR